MATIKIELALYESKRHHGTHSVTNKQQRASALAKAKALLGNNAPTSKGGEKQYGGDNIKKFPIRTFESATMPELDKNLDRMDYVVTSFEGLSSFDIQSAKHNYSAHKAEVLAAASQKSGEVLGETTTDAVVNDLASASFDYYEYQMALIIYSDEQFDESSEVTIDGKVWYKKTLRSKKRYRAVDRKLSSADVQRLISMAQDDEPLKRVARATLGRCSRLIQNPNTGKVSMVIDWGSLNSGDNERY